MKRTCTTFLVCFFAAATAAAGEPELGKARALLLGGKYAEAAEIYTRTAAKDPAAALGLARCLAAQGKLDEAAAAMKPLSQGQADLQAELAGLAFQRGDLKEAHSRADEATRLQRRQFQARWIQAELARVEGRLEEAGRGCEWFVGYYNNHDVEDAESLHWIGLAAARYARWNRLPDQFDFLVNELYPEALKADPKYWPAHYEAGLLFLEKYNEADAADELKKALALNPAAAEVHAALARLALDNRKVEEAKASIGRALEINPRLLAAWHARADLLWANFQAEEAVKLLEEKALPLCPVSEETLGRLAAGYVLLGGPEKGDKSNLPGHRPEVGRGPTTLRAVPGASHKLDLSPFSKRLAKLAADVHRRNPHAGDFYHTMAEWLEARSKMDAAERMFRQALKRMPQKIGPHSGLGMLYMRAGREAEARKLLDEAFKIDPFNVRVNNTLEVLGVLDEMARLETDQVVLRYSRADDKLLAEAAARELDKIYPELCRQFGYRPPGKPLVEIFNQAKGADGHQWFSTRLIGLPYVGTVAACTGKMVAMVSPNERELNKRFNWLRVMKHELVHVITLQQTNFNCPHWFTEALAVTSEGQPRPQVWNEVLVRRARRGKLFDLDSINFGFIRPHSSDDWALAYCQAQLYLEYMLRNHGSGVIRRLLAAYAENLSTPEAIRRVLGVSQEEFERGYLEYVKKLAAEMASLDRPEEKDFAELKKQQEARPEDADLAAELAVAYVRRGANQEARGLAEAAVKRKPKHPLATYVLARLEVNAGKPEEAIKLLAGCLDPEHPQPAALNLLAGLQLKAERYDEAASLYALGQKHDPFNLKWTQALGRVYLASKNDGKLAEVLARLARADGDDLTVRKKLAELALGKKDYEAAAGWCRQALQIDVKDAQVYRALAEAEVGGRRWAEAIGHFETAVALAPKEAQPRMALADACIQAGQPDKARQVLRELLKLAPDYPGADVLLESLDKDKK